MSAEDVAWLATASTSAISDALGDAPLMTGLRPVWPGARLAGPARTVVLSPGENGAVHRAAAAAQPGDVLVIDAGGDLSFGRFGELLALFCRRRGIAGVVIDGAIRDAAALSSMQFPIFARGTSPRACRKAARDRVDAEARCGGVSVVRNDLIVGDDDGIVVVPRGRVQGLAEKLSAVIEKERVIAARIEAGETTCAILGIDP